MGPFVGRKQGHTGALHETARSEPEHVSSSGFSET